MSKYLLTFLLVILSFSAISQESKKYQKLKSNPNYREGSVTLKNGKKLEGLIHYFNSGYTTVHFLGKDGEKYTYTARDLKSYNNSRYTFISGKISKRKWRFFKEITNSAGEIKFFITYNSSTYSDFGVQYSIRANEEIYGANNTVYYVHKNGEESFTPILKLLRIEHILAAYFSSCPKLKQRILAGEFKEIQPEDGKEFSLLVDAYNECRADLSQN